MGIPGDVQSSVVKGHRALCPALSLGLSTQLVPEPGSQQPPLITAHLPQAQQSPLSLVHRHFEGSISSLLCWLLRLVCTLISAIPKHQLLTNPPAAPLPAPHPPLARSDLCHLLECPQ